MAMRLKLIVIDIDGTMTDGSIYYGEDGVELKKFNTKDAAGILCAQALGIDCMFLTGRKTLAVEKRAIDLGVKYVFQGVKEKMMFLKSFLYDNGILTDEVLCIGDDLNDIEILRLTMLSACPADAAEEVKEICDYISEVKGGDGAVRDIVFHYLKKFGEYEKAISKAYAGI